MFWCLEVMEEPEGYQQVGINAERLQSLADELQAIAAALQPTQAKPFDDVRSTGADNPAQVPTDAASSYAELSQAEVAKLVESARRFYKSRRIRSRAFKDDRLFGEPAWDLLLDLFIAEAEGKKLSVTAACIGAAVPTSTALRWLLILEQRGLLTRESDPTDARRVFLRLTGEGYARMVDYFLQLQREGLLPA